MESVWALVGDPNRYPEWASEIVEVTGLATVEKDAIFQQVSQDQGETEVVNFCIEECDEMIRTIQMRCLESRFYLRAGLTEAQGNTFVDIETGTSKGNRGARPTKRTDSSSSGSPTRCSTADGRYPEE